MDCYLVGGISANLKPLWQRVDSTSWTTDNRFGAVYRFDGKTIVRIDKREGQRFKDSRLLAINNWNEWVKYQRFAEVKL